MNPKRIVVENIANRHVKAERRLLGMENKVNIQASIKTNKNKMSRDHALKSNALVLYKLKYDTTACLRI